MTVAELRAIIARVPDDALVVFDLDGPPDSKNIRTITTTDYKLPKYPEFLTIYNRPMDDDFLASISENCLYQGE